VDLARARLSRLGHEKPTAPGDRERVAAAAQLQHMSSTAALRRSIRARQNRQTIGLAALLQPQVGKSRMICRARAPPIPPHLPVGLCNWQVVDTGKPFLHEAVGIELPVLVAIGTKPVSRIVVPLIGKPDGNSCLRPSPQLLDQSVFELLIPLTR
jgi:hypothetical protein